MKNTEFTLLKGRITSMANRFEIIGIEEYITGLDLSEKQVRTIDRIKEQSKMMYKIKYGCEWSED